MEWLALFSAFGLSASAGLNAYIPLFITGLIAHYTDWIVLAQPWDGLANPWVLIVLGILIIIEMLADKIPAVNHLNDAIQTLIRPAAGAILFAASTKAILHINPTLALILGLLTAGAVHGVKALVVRPLVTATTGGVANTPVSILEDLIATITSLLALLLPILLVFTLAVGLLLFWFWRSRPRRV